MWPGKQVLKQRLVYCGREPLQHETFEALHWRWPTRSRRCLFRLLGAPPLLSAQVRGISVLMKNSPKRVLPFPKPTQEPEAATITVQIGADRFAIHWEIKELPPRAQVLPWKQGSKKAPPKNVK
jgi:hypothetical protein